jgi:hypothetical protein
LVSFSKKPAFQEKARRTFPVDRPQKGSNLMAEENLKSQGLEMEKGGEGSSDTAHGGGGASAADGHPAPSSATEGAPAVESAAENDREREAPREDRPEADDGPNSAEGPADGERDEHGTEVYCHVPVSKVQLHPKLDEIVPRMSDSELVEFLDDVREADAITTPILLQEDGDGYLALDGRHRLEAARAFGHVTVPARIVVWPAERQVEEIIRSSLHRRNLTDDQRAVLAAACWEEASKRARSERAWKGGKAGGRGRGKGEDSLRDDVSRKLIDAERPRGSTLDEVAKKCDVSPRKVKDARKLKKDEPELAREVLDGKKKLPAAKREAKAKAGESPAGAAPGADPEATASAGKKAAASKPMPVPVIFGSGVAEAIAKTLDGYTIKDPADLSLLDKAAASFVTTQAASLAKGLEATLGLTPAWVLSAVAYQVLDGKIRSSGEATKTGADPEDEEAGDGAGGPA